MINFKYISLCICALLTIAACSTDGGSGTDPLQPSPTTKEKLPICINTAVATRATDEAFEVGDQIGLFVVNREADGTANSLKTLGNHIDNMQFTYDGIWKAASSIYWKDETTHADFYLYYPYQKYINNVTAVPVQVKADQSDLADYKSSDMLIGKTLNAAPTDQAVEIEAKHMMSQAIITLKAGKGFTDTSLASSLVNVRINGFKSTALVNLSTGEVTATGNDTDIIPLKEDCIYKAIIIPQDVKEGNFITINVDGSNYYLARNSKFHAFEKGEKHNFTVTLSKTSSGINVNISQWEDDGIDYGGTAN